MESFICPRPSDSERTAGRIMILSGGSSAIRPGRPVSSAPTTASVRFGPDSMPQPDILLMIDPGRGGRAAISEDDYVEGAPELVVEVASSSVSYDLHAKRDVYRRHGVPEYLVWRVLDRAIDWSVLRDDRYESIAPDDRGRLRSTTFPGLWLDRRGPAPRRPAGGAGGPPRRAGQPGARGLLRSVAGLIAVARGRSRAARSAWRDRREQAMIGSSSARRGIGVPSRLE